MRDFRVLLFSLLLLLTPLTVNALPIEIGTYEISYIYNTMRSDSDNNYQIIEHVNYSDGVDSLPIIIDNLAPGNYRIQIVEGRITGNPVDKTVFDEAVDGDLDDYWLDYLEPNNPGAQEYYSGFDGGNTNPKNDTKKSWWYATVYWVGNSYDYGTGDRIWDLDGFADITVNLDDNLWLYWSDSYSKDNLGGVTVKLWQLSESTPIPEPTTMLLLGAGLIGLAGLGRKRFFKKD